jgi:hypothetical protein
MGKYQPKTPPPDPRAARSWIKKLIKDARTNTFGLVHSVVENENGLRLVARFPGESTDRLIALEMTADRECLCPGEIRARYRPLTSADRERLLGQRQAA